MTKRPEIGDVRALLQRDPTTTAFEELCVMLELMSEDMPPEAFQQRVLDYVAASLDRWPDDTRTTPLRMLRRLSRNHAVPEASVIRRLDVDLDTWGGETADIDFARLLDGLPLGQLTHISGRRLTEPQAGLLVEMLEEQAGLSLESLELRDSMVPSWAYPKLFRMEHLAGLERLVLARARCEHHHLQGMAKRTTLSPRVLVLDDNPIQQAGVNALMRPGLFTRALEHLSMQRCKLNIAALASHLDGSKQQPWALEHLDLSGNESVARAVYVLSQVDTLPRLEHLALNHTQVTATLEQLDLRRQLSWNMPLRSLELRGCGIQSSHVPALLHLIPTTLGALDLCENEIDHLGFGRLLAEERVQQLERLGMSRRDGSPDFLMHLLPGRELPKLRSLDVSSPGGGRGGARSGARALLMFPQLEHLHELDLTGWALTSADVSTLLSSRERFAMRRLVLKGAETDDDAFARLAMHPDRLVSLEHLELSFTRAASLDGLARVLRAGALPSLERLKLWGYKAGRFTRREWAAFFHHLTVHDVTWEVTT